MAKIVKLENIVIERYSSETGESVSKVVEEYVCGSCRHLIGKNDKFCWQCGEPLEQSKLVEHCFEERKLTNKEFREKVSGDIK